MRIALLAAMTALMILPSCGKIRDSRFNPFNWSRPEVTTLEPKGGYEVTADNRQLVDQVLTMAVEPMPGGAIVRAKGLPPVQGYWQAELVPENGGEPVDGVLTLRFVVYPPPGPTPSSTQPSREITVGLFLADQQLARISRITVQGQQTALSVRR
jgi:hypothetical protein